LVYSKSLVVRLQHTSLQSPGHESKGRSTHLALNITSSFSAEISDQVANYSSNVNMEVVCAMHYTRSWSRIALSLTCTARMHRSHVSVSPEFEAQERCIFVKVCVIVDRPRCSAASLWIECLKATFACQACAQPECRNDSCSVAYSAAKVNVFYSVACTVERSACYNIALAIQLPQLSPSQAPVKRPKCVKEACLLCCNTTNV
jgi:hypothetical protein